MQLYFCKFLGKFILTSVLYRYNPYGCLNFNNTATKTCMSSSQYLLHCIYSDSGSHGHEEMVRSDKWSHFFEDFAGHMRLDSQPHHFTVLHRLNVAAGNIDAKFLKNADNITGTSITHAHTHFICTYSGGNCLCM